MKLFELLNESINDKGIFKAVMMAGHPGSGKSYVLKRIKSGSIEPRLVNVDKYKEFFGIEDSELAPEVKDKTRQLTVNQLTLYLDSVLPLAVDGTSATINSVLRRTNVLHKLGYDIALVFVKCNLETALERAKKRGSESIPGEKMRKVAEKDVRKYYDEVQQIKSSLTRGGKFHPIIEIDNNEGELTDEVVTKAFKSMSAFYNSPVDNPLGKQAIEMMKENKWKYLSDGIYTLDEIRDVAKSWWHV